MSGEHTHPEVTALDTALAQLAARVSVLTTQVVALEAGQALLATKVAALEARDVYAYDYLGKPDRTQTIGRSYVRLDLSEWTPGAVGWDHLLYYLNIKPTFYAGKVGGAIRPRLVRADGDFTAYDDIPVHADCLDADGRALKTQLYWEAGDGTTTYLELKCIGGLRSAELGTRYTKRATVKDRG